MRRPLAVLLVLAMLVVLAALFAGCLGGDKAPETTTTTKVTTTKATTTSTTSTKPTTTATTTSTTTTLPRAHSGTIVDSPKANIVPTIDGVLGEGEWDDAQAVDLSESERLYVKNSRFNLFLLYEVGDRNMFSNKSALYLDANDDPYYDYAYGYVKVFLAIPLIGNISGGDGLFCGSPTLSNLPVQVCGKSYGYEMDGLEVRHMRSETNAVSEAAIPVTNSSMYLWLLHGYPTATCYPETLQCYEEPKYAEIRTS